MRLPLRFSVAPFSLQLSSLLIAAVITFGSAGIVVTSSASVTHPQSTTNQDTPDKLKESAAKLEEAILASRNNGDVGAEASGLMKLADTYRRLGENRRALEPYSKAATIFRSMNNKTGEAAALNGIGSTYARLSDYQQSIVAYEQSVALYRAASDRKGEAVALAGIGFSYRNLNDYDKALTALKQSLEISRESGDRGSEALATYYTGLVHFSRDEYELAIQAYDQSRALAQSVNDRSREGALLTATGQAYYRLRNYQRALDLYNEVLSLYRSNQNRAAEASVLGTMGQVFRALGDNEKALDLTTQAASLFRVTGERLNEATALNNSGHVYLTMGQYDKALAVFAQSVNICREVKNPAGEASNTNGLGLAYTGLNDYQKALGFHSQALEIFRSIGHRRGEADTLGHLGRLHILLATYDQALTSLNNALQIYRGLKMPREQSQTLYSSARAYQAAGKLTEAKTQIDAALSLVEILRHDVLSQQLRASYLASVRDFYGLSIDVSMQLNRDQKNERGAVEAFETSERARARTLLDLLAEANSDIRRDVDPVLLARERTLRQKVSTLAERQTQLLSGRSTPTQLASIARELEESLADHGKVQAEIKAKSSRYASLIDPQPLTAKQIQDEVLDADTVLLEYFVDNKRAYVWAVTKDAVTGFELSGMSEIEGLARRLHQLVGSNGSSAAIESSMRSLSEILLRPAAAQLNKKRIVVVADGALHYIPFAALPNPTRSQQDQYEPLIVRHEVISLPSASTLALLRSENQKRPVSSDVVAVVADPVFSGDDVRIRRGQPPPENTSSTGADSRLMRSVEDMGSGQPWPLPRLLGTRREARTILSLASSQKSRQALDFDASRETVTSPGFGSYQIVHFATHAFINNRHPELSGLVLSLVDKDGRPRDGFLRLNDVYNLRMPTELVVLSACRTGLGKEIRGEGLIGLTRGFMYAGSPRVVTSLWQADDRATSELMGHFYKRLLGPKKLTAAAALREAQLEMLRQKNWSSPYYWAGFTLQGEWK